MNQNVKKSYQKLTSHYVRDVDTKPYNAYLERPAMVEAMPPLKDKQVLDAGCAAGWYSQYMAEEGAVVTAVDFSPSMVEATRRRTETLNVTTFVHDISTQFPLASESLDVIVSSLTLHYIKDWEAVFKEFARLLKPGGTLLFSTHHPFMDYDRFDVENYYDVQLLKDQWTVNGERVPMEFYRRPLNQIINLTMDQFNLSRIIEPLPTEEFKHLSPQSYEKVRTTPNFIILKAEKPEAR
ncbi:class I SAM-dependent methyltransferase [Halobacillus yeomjeoni]|uniref:Class I SAM-dependent methyltransferase n=1 Tax=Halobacillus yeomjeoni TaxID=311194 RepID=A0A931HR66_9BACI|nr:class I SAM-dependent methyltransferase [Halobacillus yeomjeoni]MBH0228650.1 class I SAM-dependent methyltransferase [Halobacillus yeomjeoni]